MPWPRLVDRNATDGEKRVNSQVRAQTQSTFTLARPRDSRVFLALSGSPPYLGHFNTSPISHAMGKLKTTPAHFIELSTLTGGL